RRGVAGGHGPGDGIAANGSLVSKGGLAVKLASFLATWRRSVGQRLTAVDVVTLLYIAVATAAVLAFSAQDHASWDLLLTAHALLVTLVLVAPLARQAGPVSRFLGDWYPMLLLGALYASPLGLWFSGRRDAARRTIFAVMVTFYICYVVFLFFPVAGPRYTFDLADNAATSVWPARATQWLLDLGDSWGAAFPSSHVAAAVVAALCALRYWRPLGLLLTPLTVGLVLSVVYGQFHYAVDAVAGLIVACAVLASQYIYASQPAPVAAALPGRELETGRA